MGTSCHVCLEARIDGAWTHLTYFWLGRKDSETYYRLGFDPDRASPSTAPTDWTRVSRWHFFQDGGSCPTTVPLDVFRAVAEQQRLESPDKFDLRPGWISPFQEWLEKEVRDPPGWSISSFLGQWPAANPDENLGTEVRLCIWFT
jgi:hypothetical protein